MVYFYKAMSVPFGLNYWLIAMKLMLQCRSQFLYLCVRCVFMRLMCLWYGDVAMQEWEVIREHDQHLRGEAQMFTTYIVSKHNVMMYLSGSLMGLCNLIDPDAPSDLDFNLFGTPQQQEELKSFLLTIGFSYSKTVNAGRGIYEHDVWSGVWNGNEVDIKFRPEGYMRNHMEQQHAFSEMPNDHLAVITYLKNRTRGTDLYATVKHDVLDEYVQCVIGGEILGEN